MQPGAEPGAYLREMKDRTSRLRESAEVLRAELAELTVAATSPDRFVTVTVGAGGVMRNIRVEAGGQRATATQIAAAVMKAYGAGCRDVGQRSAALVEAHMPSSPVANLMRDAIPPAEEETEL